MYTRKFFILLVSAATLLSLHPTQSISRVSSAPVSNVIEFNEHSIDSDFGEAHLVYAADLDGDEDTDIFGANYSQVAWWENDGQQHFTRHIISTGWNDVHALQAADLDSDNDIDILGAVYWQAGILWWENDGAGIFTEHWVDENFNWAFSVFAVDLDGDNDMDVLGASMDSSDVAWWENDGKESFTKRIVDEDHQSANCVYGIDMDGDNDIDIVASALDDAVVWFENDGNENFTLHRVQPYLTKFEGIHSVLPSDLDNDGDIDVLGTEWQLGSSIAWWVNDGTNSFTEDRIYAGPNGATAVYVSDVNADGHMDVQGAGEEISWMQNDGSADFIRQVIADREASCIHTSDLDGDDDLDVLTAGGEMIWWEQLSYRLVLMPLALSVGQPPSTAPIIDPIANPDGDGNYNVSWSTVEQAASYTLQEDNNVSFSSPNVVYAGPETSESISGKGLGTFYYRVQASGGLGSSDWSKTEWVEVTVKLTPVPGPEEGSWSGTTDQDQPIRFEVSSGYVSDLTIDYLVSCPGSVMWKTKTFDDLALIFDDGFEFDADGDPTVEGEFTSNTHASGTWSSSFSLIGVGTCQGSGTWSADGP